MLYTSCSLLANPDTRHFVFFNTFLSIYLFKFIHKCSKENWKRTAYCCQNVMTSTEEKELGSKLCTDFTGLQVLMSTDDYFAASHPTLLLTV